MFSEKFSLKKTFAERYNPLCIGNPGPPKLYGTRKVVQLTGDIDRETGNKTLNQTVKRFEIYGTDLGISFIYNGKLYFLFGDTTRRGPIEGLPKSALPGTHYNENETDYDAIAYTTSDRAYDGIFLTFNLDPPIVNNISQLTAETPIEGFSIGDDMYVFFATDMDREKRILPTRSVLAKSIDGGYKFGNSLYTLSTNKFIHVSVQIVDNDKIQGLPKSTGKGLLLWGTGKYRESDIYLAYMPLDEITNRSSISFFSGFEMDSNRPSWKADESLAKPLFSASCIGELSIRWNYYLGKWIMLYNCDLCNTNGVIVRLADDPWGPWSVSRIVFDPADGYKRFIHLQGQDNLVDEERDDKTNPYDLGYPYGPYQMTPYATGIRGRYTKIYFTLSVWNPYQVLQMSAIILNEIMEEVNPLPYATGVNDRNDRKYAYISVLLSHLANTKKLEFKNPFGSSTFIADHIEWAQFHTHLELRNELKSKISQLMNSIAVDTDISDAYTAINSSIARLAYDYNLFNNVVNVDIYKKWALNAVHSGNRELLIDEINKMIDSKQFLPDHDYLCYAYSSEDSNEFKYARISLLEAKMADSFKIKWDLPHQGMLDCNSYVTWARFRHIEELRKDLICKFKQMVYKFPSSRDIANAFTEIIKVILDLSDKIIDSEPDAIRYKRALSMINSNDQEMVIKELLKYIQNDSFLIPIPTNNISL
jgi:hypothetical protein